MFNKTGRQAIDRAIGKNLDYLVRFAFYRLGNRVEAEDTVYDAVLRFLEKAPERLGPESVRLYLFRIVYNLCADRSRGKSIGTVDIESVDMADEGDAVLDMDEVARLNECLEALPRREAEVIRMNVVDGLSFVEISGIMSIPPSTAKSRYKSGMDKLRKLFTDK